jgi:peptidyl-tRNA hydrolase, PTH1 family
MWLIVGLGNPGPKYALHRHNIGFMAVDTFLKSVNAPLEKTEQKSLTTHLTLHSEDNRTSEKVLFCKPQTFMNLSGDPVRGLLDFYKIDLANLIVIHDEIDFPFGQLKIQKERGHGGHNGIRDIHEKLGTNKYYRIKLGVGRSANPNIEVADHVLSNFSKDEMLQLPDFLNTALDAVESLIFQGYDKAANHFNSLKTKETP